MQAAALKIGCQTFTWEMLGERWTGSAGDLVSAIAAAGYQGIEITDTMIGDYGDRPEAFAKRLDAEGLELVAFAFGSGSGFSERAAMADDLEAVERWVGFVATFPGAVASLGSATQMSEGKRVDKLAVAAEIYNRAADVGRASGVDIAVHPSSHHNTLLFDRSDYDAIFASLEPEVCWVPDTGHMLRGGMDPAATMADFAERIRYVHLKDVGAGGDWAMLGAGVCDTAAVAAAAQAGARFNGWLVVEEESAEAEGDPAGAVQRNRQAARRLLGS